MLASNGGRTRTYENLLTPETIPPTTHQLCCFDDWLAPVSPNGIAVYETVGCLGPIRNWSEPTIFIYRLGAITYDVVM